MSLERELEAFLAAEEKRKTQFGKSPTRTAIPEEFGRQSTSMLETVGKPMGDFTWGEAATEAGANFLWNFADEFSLGTIGMAEEYDWLGEEKSEYLTKARDYLTGEAEVGIDPETGEEITFRAGPQTTLGKAGAGVGTLAGFMAGLPKYGLTLLGRGLTKGAAIVTGKETTAAAFKKAGKKASEKVGDDLFAGAYQKRLHSSLGETVAKAHKPGIKNNPGKYKEFINKELTTSLNEGVKSGLITKEISDQLSTVYLKYLSDRPLTSVVDLFTSSMTNKKLAFTLGSMVQESFMFGMLDAVREGIHVVGSHGEHKYDISHPAWGATVGGLFGMSKWYQAGKSSSGKVDLLSTIRAKLADSQRILSKNSTSELMSKTEMLGADLKPLGLQIRNVKSNGQKFRFDTTNPQTEAIRILKDSNKTLNDVNKAELLRNVFGDATNTIGNQLIKWTARNSWANIRENFPRMVWGGFAMNARSWYDMYNGMDIPNDDIAINFLLGAALNRKGLARRTDMFPEQIQRLRRGLHTLDVLPIKYATTNPITGIPTLDPAISSTLNPFASDKKLNQFVKLADEKGLLTDNFDNIDTPIEISQGKGVFKFGRSGTEISVSQSSKDLAMFERFYRFLQGASPKKYVKSKDSISETTAKEINDALGKEYGDVVKLGDHLTNVADRVGERFESEIVKGAIEIIQILEGKKIIANPGDGSIGPIPNNIIIGTKFFRLAREGKLGELLPYFDNIKPENQEAELYTLRDKLHKILQTNIELDKASKRETNQAVFIENASTLESVLRHVHTMESSINSQLGLNNTATNKFNFNNVDDLLGYMSGRILTKRIAKFSKLFDKDSPHYKEVLSLLIDTGIIQSTTADLRTGLKMVESIEQIKFLDIHGKVAKDKKIISDNTLFMSALLNIMGSKNQYRTTKGNVVYMSTDKVFRLKALFNKLGINVDGKSLQDLASQVVQRVTFQNLRDSSLTPEQKGVFSSFLALGSPTVGQTFKLMHWHKPGGNKATGMMLHEIGYLGSDVNLQKIVTKYNEYVQKMHRNGKAPGKDNIVVMGDKFELTTESSILAIESVMQDALIKSNTTAARELTAFFMQTASQETGRNAALTFMAAYPEKASKLTRLLLHTGALEMKPGKGKTEGTYEYHMNQNKWDKNATQTELKKFIQNYGVNMDTLEMMTNRAKKDVESYMDETYGLGDHRGSMSLPEFFKRYLPDKSSKPNEMVEFLSDRLYNINGSFAGYKGIIDIFNEMKPKVTAENANEAYTSLLQIVTNHIESKPKKVYFFSNGKIQSKDSNMHAFDNPYYQFLEDLNIPHALVDGITHDWNFSGSNQKLRFETFDIFQADSNIQNNYDKQIMVNRKKAFLELLRKKTDVEGFESGFEIIEMPGMKLSLVVSKDPQVVNRIKERFEEIYKKNIDKIKSEDIKNGTENEDLLRTVRENLKQSTEFDQEIHQVFRALIAESMMTGKDKSLFTDLLNMNETDLNKFFVGRQTMFNTSKFKRINSEVLNALLTSVPTMNREFNKLGLSIYIEGLKAASKYNVRKKAGIVIYNDDPNSGLGFSIKTAFEKQNPGKKWEDYYADRKNESGVDSITFISKEFADFLGFYYGTPGAKIFKPIISSQGEGNLLYGKTAFEYDPNLEGFFKSNPKVDILMSGSADKLKLAGDRILEFRQDQMYGLGKINNKHTIEVPLDAIGIQKIPDHYQPGKIAQSVINNHTDRDLAARMYNDYIAPELNHNLQKIRDVINNPFVENELLRVIKSDMTNGSRESSEILDGAGYHMSAQLEWLNLSPYSSLDIFGSSAKLNIFKSKYLDTALSPKSEFKNTDGEIVRFGAKTVIGQRFGTELEGTLFNNETGKIERYGEILIPEAIGAEDILFNGRNFNVKVINTKTNEVSNAKDIFMKINKEIMEGRSDQRIQDLSEKAWNFISRSERPLEALFKFFDKTTGVDKVRYDIGISTLRYPRTRPNDLHLLRLRGFVEGSGQKSIVNKFDVYNIFEGDYDVDAVDFFWGGSNAWYQNIIRQQKVFVPTADVASATATAENLPSIRLLSRNAKANNQQWSVLNGNKRAIANLKGVVQATSAKVKYIDNIAAVKTNSEGISRKIILRNPRVKEGEPGYWEVRMDWDNADFHLRQALEGQILLDATAPDPSILKTTRDWMTDFLFPRYSDGNTVSKDTFINIDGTYNPNKLRLFINSKSAGGNEYKDKRVRLFRKFEYVREGKDITQNETDLTSSDIQLIKNMMSEYSKILEVLPGRKVYTQGDPKKATYEQMVNAANRYFTYTNRDNFVQKSFNKLWHNQTYDPDTGDATYTFQGGLKSEVKDYFNNQPFEYYKYEGTGDNKRKVKKYARFKQKPIEISPFPKQLIENMHRTSEGELGGIAEKSLYEIYKDPLNRLHMDTRVLTNETFLQEQKLVHELLENDNFDVTEMNNFIPRLMYEVKKDINMITRLKKNAFWLKKSRAKNKDSKLKALNDQISLLEDKIRPLLKKEYKKTRSAKDIDFLKTVDIQSNKEYIDGTVSYFTLNYARGIMGEMNNKPGYKTSVREARMLVGQEFGYLTELYGQGYGTRSIHSNKTERILSKTKTINDVELEIHDLITKNINEHGITWLWDFAMPSNSSIENYIGVFKGNVMPMAVKPSGNYKRAIRWLLDAHSGKLQEGFYVAHEGKYHPEQFTKVLKQIAEADFTYRQFFNGRNKYLPMDVFEVNKMMTYGAPRFSWKMDNMFSKYTDLQSTKHLDDFNPFGMGKRYNQQIQFFRSLSNLSEKTSGEQFDKGAGILSYTNQLMMENGFLTPHKVLSLMADATNELGDIINKVYPASIDIRTGQAVPIKPFDLLNNPMHVLIGGDGLTGSSMSLNPYKAMSPFARNKQKALLRQTKNIIETKENEWKKEYFETNQTEDLLTKPGDC